MAFITAELTKGESASGCVRTRHKQLEIECWLGMEMKRRKAAYHWAAFDCVSLSNFSQKSSALQLDVSVQFSRIVTLEKHLRGFI